MTCENDFNIKMTVRNARLLREIRKHSDSVAAFCKKNGLKYTSINALICMRVTPVSPKMGNWRPIALDLSAALGVAPELLWPEHLVDLKLSKSTAEAEMSFGEVQNLLTAEQSYQQRELLQRWISTLTPREQKVLRMRYFENYGLDEVGKEIGGVTAGRVQQIEAKALRKLRKGAVIDRIEAYSEFLE